jgi:hypothetical protein
MSIYRTHCNLTSEEGITAALSVCSRLVILAVASLISSMGPKTAWELTISSRAPEILSRFPLPGGGVSERITFVRASLGQSTAPSTSRAISKVEKIMMDRSKREAVLSLVSIFHSYVRSTRYKTTPYYIIVPVETSAQAQLRRGLSGYVCGNILIARLDQAGRI